MHLQPKIGLRFAHSRVRDEHGKPMIFKVTKIARRIIYYRPESGGAPQFCDVSDFCKWARAITEKISTDPT